ncbi:MAG: hypothetical protein EVG15_07060 [Candidatus Acididesulfobacter diazotrophicus]|uniref:IstB-like ATP-binding domain-containing protein n=1 Tax=Candidatus Acididesulfobacter diazotrophicus TaxID=2597226 RepID=A0A519BLX8_9DELT|nr:MAG: hypothetical protein EVG15_07060 [Candidatus Acididesulfobacter diazotrophicus]
MVMNGTSLYITGELLGHRTTQMTKRYSHLVPETLKKAVDEFFEIIRRRYETGSIIITTNRPFEEWANIFGDAVLASAILDRVIHHSIVFKITGNSYRMKELIKNNQ